MPAWYQSIKAHTATHRSSYPCLLLLVLNASLTGTKLPTKKQLMKAALQLEREQATWLAKMPKKQENKNQSEDLPDIASNIIAQLIAQ